VRTISLIYLYVILLFLYSAVWVDEDDIRIYTMKKIDDPCTLKKIVYIRPPENILSQKELVAKWEQLSGFFFEENIHFFLGFSKVYTYISISHFV
jgi:hypothetical protein